MASKKGLGPDRAIFDTGLIERFSSGKFNKRNQSLYLCLLLKGGIGCDGALSLHTNCQIFAMRRIKGCFAVIIDTRCTSSRPTRREDFAMLIELFLSVSSWCTNVHGLGFY